MGRDQPRDYPIQDWLARIEHHLELIAEVLQELVQVEKDKIEMEKRRRQIGRG